MNAHRTLTSRDRLAIGRSFIRALTTGVFLMLGTLLIGTTTTHGQSTADEWLPRPAIIDGPRPSAPASGVACLGTHPIGGNLVISPYGVASLISSNRVSPIAGLTLPLVGPIDGRVGRTYRIERRDDASEANPWFTVDQVTLPRTPYLWIDSVSNRRNHGLYRLILLP